MNRIRAWLSNYLTPPPHLSRAEQRFFVVASAIYPAAALVHVGFMGIFAWLDVPPMVGFNLLSIAMWVVAAILTRSRRFIPGAIVGGFELILHALLAVYFVGSEFGFQYYLLSVIAASYLLPVRRSLLLYLGILCVILFIVLSLQPQLWQGDPLIPVVISIYNIASSMGAVAIALNYYRGVTDSAEAELEEAHAKSEGLLLNILPDEIAQRLKQNDGTIADGYASTSVLFADIADFTPMSQRMTPAEVVQMLDDLFSRFDVLVRKHKLEKIKTIGDAYMVAAGVPTPRPDHAEAMVAFAREMQQAILEYNAEKGTAIRVRIGINSGPVVAGGDRQDALSVRSVGRLREHRQPHGIAWCAG